MKAVLKTIVALIAGLLVAMVAGAYLIPADAVVQRQTTIEAPPETVFAIAGDLRRFPDWSPWAALDPAATYRFEGPERGVGQVMRWDSANPQVGRGSQTVVEYVENRKLVTDLDFGSMGKAQASLLLAPVGGATGVTWGFKATATGVVDRWTSLLYDRWIGADYETGLARLKALAEAEAGGG